MPSRHFRAYDDVVNFYGNVRSFCLELEATHVSFLHAWPDIDRHMASLDAFLKDHGRLRPPPEVPKDCVSKSVVCLHIVLFSQYDLDQPGLEQGIAQALLVSPLLLSSIDDDLHIQAVPDSDLAVHIEASHMTDVRHRCSSWMFQGVLKMARHRHMNFLARCFALVRLMAAAS